MLMLMLKRNNIKKICISITILLVTLSLSGCFAEFEENIYGTWISKHKIQINDIYEKEYEYLIFLRNGKYETNIFQHLFVTGNYYLKQEDGDYFFQLEYKGNTTTFQYTYEDDSYDVLKIKNDEDIVTVFHRDKSV